MASGINEVIWNCIHGNERWEKFTSAFVAACLTELNYKGGLFWSGQKKNGKL